MAAKTTKVIVECTGTITRKYVVTLTEEEYDDENFNIDNIDDLKERIDNDTAVKMKDGDEIEFDDIGIVCDLEDGIEEGEESEND